MPAYLPRAQLQELAALIAAELAPAVADIVRQNLRTDPPQHIPPPVVDAERLAAAKPTGKRRARNP